VVRSVVLLLNAFVTMSLRQCYVCTPYIRTDVVHHRLTEEVRVNGEALMR